MKLPGYERAVVPMAKVVDYLLSPDHPSGRGKARFFQQFGFARDDWRVLADAIRSHAARYDVQQIEDSPFGRRYTIEGPIVTPDGRKAMVRTVWFIESDEAVPRFVTAYPLPRRRT